MFQGKEWGTVLRFWADDLRGAYRNHVELQASERQDRLKRTVGLTIPGASIVMLISLMERLVLDCLRQTASGTVAEVRLADSSWRTQLGLPMSWDGWALLEGVVALRNCFAHEYGRVTTRQSQPVQDFLSALAADTIQVTLVNQGQNGEDKTYQIDSFYKIDSQQNVVLDEARCSQALRLLGMGLLRQLESAGHVNL